MTRMRFDHNNMALCRGLPFLKKATAGIFNINLGITAKIIDFKAVIDHQPHTDVNESFTIPVAMVYVGFNFPQMNLE
jgi:hypothetical protein